MPSGILSYLFDSYFLGLIRVRDPRFNDIGIIRFSLRLRIVRVDFVTWCGLGNYGKSLKQTRVPTMLLVFQEDVAFLISAGVSMSSGAEVRENGFPHSTFKTYYLASPGAIPFPFSGLTFTFVHHLFRF